MKITLTRTETGSVEIDYDAEAFDVPTGELEAFLQDCESTIRSAPLDAQPNMTSEEGWKDDPE